MNTKKLLAILLAAIMMLALAACGDEPAPTPVSYTHLTLPTN